MSSPATFELRGMDIFGTLDVDAEEQRHAAIEAEFETLQLPLVFPTTQTATAANTRMLRRKIGHCANLEEFELSAAYLTNCGEDRIRGLMVKAGITTVEHELREEVSSGDDHDRVRFLAIVLINTILKESRIHGLQPVSSHELKMEELCHDLAQWEHTPRVRFKSNQTVMNDYDLEMEELCHSFAKWEHTPRVCFSSYQTGMNAYDYPIRAVSDEEWNSPASISPPSWSYMRDEIEAFPGVKPFFPGEESNTSSADTVFGDSKLRSPASTFARSPFSSSTSLWSSSGSSISISAPSSSSSVYFDEEDVVMSDFEDMDYEMDLCPSEHEVKQDKAKTTSGSSQAALAFLREVQALVNSKGKRKRNAEPSTRKKRARKSSPPFPTLRLRKVSSVDSTRKATSTPSSPTTPTKPKPTSIIRPTQFVHKSQPRNSKLRWGAESLARCAERLCAIPRLLRTVVVRRG